MLLISNASSPLVLGWHGSNAEITDQVLTSSYMQIGLDHSLMIFFLLGMIVTLAGGFIIKKHDLLVSDLETGVA